MKTQQFELETMLKRVEEMREFFKFGEDVIPFLGELFKFLQGVMPLMTEVSQSIRDSTSKLPTASIRIKDVSQSTELATNEIMDKLDTITEKMKELARADSEEHRVTINEINEEIIGIIYALQFQDITSQKLEHANRILTAIYEKFIFLFESLEKVRVSSGFDNQMDIVFGSSEKIVTLKEKSSEFNQKTEDKIRSSVITQDDIDSLFD